jgi:SM-20-related protein
MTKNNTNIARKLADDGFCILENALPAKITLSLAQYINTLPKDTFSHAGIGRGKNLHLDNKYRTDKILWLESKSTAETAYLDYMEQLRLDLNQQLFMGLFDYEAHFAHYGPGAFYKRHLDAFKGKTNRVVTTVFYLNDAWREKDGGELLIYKDKTSQTPFTTVSPKLGTLVIFLSDQFPHEVLSAQRDRHSIAGWFRVKATGAMIDPAH